uniref:Uncharacterized protein n=1 Tax=Anguilla anguilla TaxID=7936 RepID=A0A0E9SCV3_ANGAN
MHILYYIVMQFVAIQISTCPAMSCLLVFISWCLYQAVRYSSSVRCEADALLVWCSSEIYKPRTCLSQHHPNCCAQSINMRFLRNWSGNPSGL